jgi:hypothetical protein
MPFCSLNGQIKVQWDEYPELAKKVTENVPDGKALFIFEGIDGFNFESDNENLPQPLKNGMLYKVFINVEPPAGKINISYPGAESENIDYGRMQLEKTLPAIKNMEIRYFKLSIVKQSIVTNQLFWADQTNTRKKVLADIPTSENDALVIIYSNPQNLDLQFEGDTSSIDRESDRYCIYMKTGNQKLKVKSKNFNETIIELDSLKKEVRYFLIFAPQSSDDVIVEDPNIKIGNYAIETTPPGALIQMIGNPFFNEKNIKTPYTFKELKSGTEIITLSLDRYEPVRDTIIIISSSKGKISKKSLIPKFAFLNCNIEPQFPESTILLDGIVLTGIENGKDFEISKGNHTIEISAPHYYPQTKQISLAAGQLSELNVKLRPKMGYLTIESGDNAEGAEVILNNGKSIGNLPVLNYLIQEGDYTVRFNKKGFVTNDLDYRIQIEDKKTTNFGKVDMLGLQKVRITSDPVNGAFVFIDGKQVGTTPLNIDLVIGQYKVLVKKEKYEDLTQTIDLQSNQRKFNYNLIPAYNFEVNTRPSGAQVFLDGVSKGYSPVNFSASLIFR